jgi:hypothetical protein
MTMRSKSNPCSYVMPRSAVALLGFALSAWSVVSCGAETDAGNPGSETHWLSACESDADCGEYSCFCGTCTVACQTDGDCVRPAGGIEASCAEQARLGSSLSCASDVPARICAANDGLENEGADGGEPTIPFAPEPVTPGPEPMQEPTAGPDGEPTQEPDTGPEPQVTPTEMVICDGSDTIRLVIGQTSGSPQGLDSQFFSSQSARFLAVDGRCNYWVSTGLGRMGVGTLDEPDLLQAYESIVYGKALTEYSISRCPDAPAVYLWDPYTAVYASPICEQSWPEDWAEAFARGTDLLTALADASAPNTGPLRIFLQPGDDDVTPTEWPLTLDPTSVIHDSETSGAVDWSDPDLGALFHPGPDAEALRAARSTDGALDTRFEYRTISGDVGLVKVMMRDEPPPRVRGALEMAFQTAVADVAEIGLSCEADTSCGSSSLQCSVSVSSGEGACSVCLGPDDREWACQDNDDCCDGLVCCVDCGEDSGLCLAEVDPCQGCLDRGGTWLPLDDVCSTDDCVPDSVCFSGSCPEACGAGNCGGCFDGGQCWAAGCEWTFAEFSSVCVPLGSSLPLEPCSVDATDPSLPGVTVHLEADTCAFSEGQGGQFRYSVTLDESLDFTTESSGGACGLCGAASELDTWVGFTISGEGASYCPECDVGCCAPTEAAPTTVEGQSITGTVDWPGLQWSGPSDTGNEPTGAFPVGEHTASVTVTLPGLGTVTANLPITVSAIDN